MRRIWRLDGTSGLPGCRRSDSSASDPCPVERRSSGLSRRNWGLRGSPRSPLGYLLLVQLERDCLLKWGRVKVWVNQPRFPLLLTHCFLLLHGGFVECSAPSLHPSGKNDTLSSYLCNQVTNHMITLKAGNNTQHSLSILERVTLFLNHKYLLGWFIYSEKI